MREKIENNELENMEREIISLITADGDEVEAEVLIFFEIEETGKKYLVYTYNEKDKNEMVTVYASSFVEEDGNIYLDDIESDDEWEKVKEVMRQTIKVGGDE